MHCAIQLKVNLMFRVIILIFTIFWVQDFRVHAQALPACSTCSPFDVIYTPMGVMTRSEAEGFLQNRAALIAAQNQRINRGVQKRVDATVAQFHRHIKGNDAASALRTRKWAVDMTTNLYAWGISGIMDEKIEAHALQALVKRMPSVPLRDAQFLVNQGLNNAGLIQGMAKDPQNAKYTVTQYGGETVLNIIEASGRVSSRVLGRANAAVALGTLAIDSTAITAEAMLDLSDNQKQSAHLKEAAARLVAQSPAVQLQRIQQTEDILRAHLAPASPPLLTPQLGGILVEVTPILSEDVSAIQKNALSQMHSLN